MAGLVLRNLVSEAGLPWDYAEAWILLLMVSGDFSQMKLDLLRLGAARLAALGDQNLSPRGHRGAQGKSFALSW